MTKKILSIQSQLVYGYVGNNIATLAVQLHKLDMISLPTVLLSAHTGHEEVYGLTITKSLFQDWIKGIKAINILDNVDYIVTGYVGSEDIIEASAEFIKELKDADPNKRYICDPVMGDTKLGGLYIPQNVASHLIEILIPLCDILTPNHFEIEYILQREIKTIEELRKSIKEHPVLSCKTLIVTSSSLTDTPQNMIEVIILSDGNVTRIHSKKIDVDLVGTGDLFASLIASQMTKGNNLENSVQIASHYISEVIEYVDRKGYNEMNSESLVKYSNMLEIE